MNFAVVRFVDGEPTTFVFESEQEGQEWIAKAEELVNEMVALENAIGQEDAMEYLSRAFRWLNKASNFWCRFGKEKVPTDIRSYTNIIQSAAGIPQTNWEE